MILDIVAAFLLIVTVIGIYSLGVYLPYRMSR